MELAEPTNTKLRCELLLALGDAYVRAGPGSGDAPQARDCYAEAFELAQIDDDAASMARSAVGFAGLNIVTAFGGEQQLQMLEAALAVLDSSDSALRVHVLGRLAVDLWNRSTANEARSNALADDAVASALRLGDQGLIAFALWARHFSGWRPDNLDERLRAARRLATHVSASGDPVVEAWGAVALAIDLIEASDLRAAEQTLDRLRQSVERSHIPYAALRDAAYRGCLALLTGRYVVAEELVTRARELWKSNTPRMHQLQPFVLLRDLGRLDELAEDIQLPDSFNQWNVATRAHRMALALERGQLDAARNDYAALTSDDFAHVPFDAYWFGVLAPLAEASIVFADRTRAEQLTMLLEPYADRLAMVTILGVGHGPVSLYLGQLAMLLERWDVAAQRLDQALAHATRLGLRPYVARALLAQARLRGAQATPGTRAEALQQLDEAQAEAETIGMAGLLPAIEQLRAGLVERQSDRLGLSARELEVLLLVVDGLSDAEVAERLFLSPRTVNSHLTSIYGKLGVSSRMAAARVARDHALW